jgi:hypothetical protein
MQPLPIGIQTFSKIVEGNYLYVDKTKKIYELIQEGSAAYFFARPRRFGKSLTLSVLDEIFSGNKELFSGLWIESSDYNWKKHPVLRFDFSKQKARNPEELIRFIFNEINWNANRHGITLSTIEYFAQFEELIRKTSSNQKCVILIDEYDKPIIDHLTNTELAKEMREVMKGFFTVLKGSDPYIRFLFLTGVSKFSKAGVFSNLNHLRDISFEEKFSDLVGITQDELERYFQDYIQALSEKEKLSVNDTLQKIRTWYNGYRFSISGETVYNPFSTLLLFTQKKFVYHWFETGTPEFLVKLILQNGYDISAIPMQTSALQFSSYEVEDLSITPLLVQTGYLTITNYDEKDNIYTLDFPNLEVKDAFLNYLYKKMQKKEETSSKIYELSKALQGEDLETCMEILQEVFWNLDYDIQIQQEKYYQTVFYLVFTLLGFRIQTEVKTSRGRVDAIVETNSIYIFEFKLNGTKEEALSQIKKKKYYEKYLSKGNKIYLVGVEFKERELGDYVVEEM